MTGGAVMPTDPVEYEQRKLSLRRNDVSDDFAPGELVELPPCVPDHWLPGFEKIGRPCPKVDLLGENEIPALIARACTVKHTMPIAVGAVISAMLTDPDEAPAMLRRVNRVLTTEKMLDLLYPAKRE